MNKEEISSESQVAIEQNRQDLQEGLEKVYLHQLVVESMVQIVVEVLMNQLLIIPKQYNPIPNIIDSILYTWSITRSQVKQYIHLYLSLLFNDESKIALINLKQETVDNFGLFCSRFLSQTYYSFDYEIFSPYIAALQSKKDMEKEDEEEGAEEGHLSEQPFQIKEYFMLKVFRELSLLVSSTSLEKSIPESFHIFFPQKKEDIINLNYSKEEDFEYIMKMLNEKKNADSLWSYMENEDDFSLYFNIFFECLLKKMMPSQTHLRILFERYLVIFQKGKDKIDNYHAFITKKVLHFWQKSEFQLERYLIKFIDDDILSVDSIIEEILFQISEIKSQQDNQYQLIRYFQVILKLLRLQYLNYVNNEENKKNVESALDLLLEKSNKLELNNSNLDIIHEFLEQIIIYYHSFLGANSKKIVQEMKPMLLEELLKI
ncbi:hypothetical protein PPERSA_10105 [Pseudocohnilembus persalinus]|uniref:Uncharacterized protein n=1 Tax=Pseudocohnilembus persalinus TaxID=266149 RepID=A0A0V0RA75_PSEPJ|nr:hypothetical protein PPERSA_10105 [Pseudocohnilembus persalinus]|eukprot:KRX11173.1 hypothetical protein PPERSA_10105 [Pseudocohnilembus persalinus]